MTDRIEGSCPSLITTDPTTIDVATTSSTSGDSSPEASGFRELLANTARSLASGEATLDASIARLSRGRTMSPEELIGLQANVYRHAAEVEMAAKLTDKLTSAVRTLLTSQQ